MSGSWSSLVEEDEQPWSPLVEGDEQSYRPRGKSKRNDALAAEAKKFNIMD